MDSASPAPKILIIGAGIFGTSTAYHLSLTHPSPSDITVLDVAPFPPPPAASADFNKIIRADYSSPFYMALAHEALDAWSANPLLKPLYHRTGWVALDEHSSDLSERIRANFRASGREDVTRDVGFEEVRSGWGGVLQDADLRGFGSAYWNPSAGWAEAGKAVEVLMQQALSKGVRYVVGEADELLLGAKGVDGARCRDGTTIQADKVLCATGAWTSKLLSGVEDVLGLASRDRIERQLTAAVVCVAHYNLGSSEYEKYRGMPVIVYGENGEVLPPTGDRILKFTNANTLTNMVHTSGHLISVPPPGDQSVIPSSLKNETHEIIKRTMPSLVAGGRQADFWRFCWDAITPTQDPLITSHPHPCLSNLYLAVGGSFHGYKFLPIIGKYVANVLSAVSNGQEKDLHWSWKCDEPTQRGAHENVVPQRDLKQMQ